MNNINWSKKSILFLAATLATAFWGSAYPSIKIGYELFSISSDDIGSKVVFAGYRFMLAGFIVLSIFFVTSRRNNSTHHLDSTILDSYSHTHNSKSHADLYYIRNAVFAFVTLGIIQTTLQYVFFYIGLANTTGAKGSIINSCSAFFGVILAPIFYRADRLTMRKIIGCIIGFLGIIILNFDGSSLSGFRINGEGFVLMSTLMATLASFYSKKIVRSYDVFLTTGMQLLIGGTVLLIIGFVDGGNISFNYKGIILLLYMAIISSVGFSLWTMLLKYNPASEVSIYNLFIPVFGNIFSGVFLHEQIFTLINLSAIICVCLGIVFVNYTETTKSEI